MPRIDFESPPCPCGLSRLGSVSPLSHFRRKLCPHNFTPWTPTLAVGPSKNHFVPCLVRKPKPHPNTTHPPTNSSGCWAAPQNQLPQPNNYKPTPQRRLPTQQLLSHKQESKEGNKRRLNICEDDCNLFAVL